MIGLISRDEHVPHVETSNNKKGRSEWRMRMRLVLPGCRS
jgi:hypothetical protein